MKHGASSGASSVEAPCTQTQQKTSHIMQMSIKYQESSTGFLIFLTHLEKRSQGASSIKHKNNKITVKKKKKPMLLGLKATKQITK